MLFEENKMKRLFQVVDTSTKKQFGSEFYPDKRLAKLARAKANADHNSETRFVVSPGPDHYKFKP